MQGSPGDVGLLTMRPELPEMVAGCWLHITEHQVSGKQPVDAFAQSFGVQASFGDTPGAYFGHTKLPYEMRTNRERRT